MFSRWVKTEGQMQLAMQRRDRVLMVLHNLQMDWYDLTLSVNNSRSILWQDKCTHQILCEGLSI